MNKNILILSFIFSFIFFNCFSQNGKLERGKKSLKTTRQHTSSKSSKKIANNNYDNRIENPFARIIWGIAAYTVYGVAIESPWELKEKMHDAEIAHYPYENSFHGNFIYTDSINYNITRFDVSNNFVLENNNLYGNNFDVNFRFFKRFSLDLSYLFLTEKVMNKRDYFYLYSVLLEYHRIRTQKLDAWFGLGIMHVGKNVNKSGFGLGVGAEWFIKKPVSFSFSHKWTSINNREVHNTKFLLKYYLKNYHISSGYEHFKIGVSKINAFSIGLGVSF